MMTLPLAIIAAALVRTLARLINGKHFRAGETPIAQDSEDWHGRSRNQQFRAEFQQAEQSP